ncbi:isoaspartyl peptidase/L-asparaginase family protein [Streptomyces buecherae]|uniref:Isoaspartyl peptidase/L-asparaginase n=1 Tax=Streptomyces buecherae TaxID=2763006 RepID=A0A7H8N1X2_9ACTN|nr:isoaspartyl peptidase/L-asparaginase [Streptomyces buecherae]QKW48510.1 isoaspartyl peptidase/L-asparaginase [Streptomyces buecherae]
MTTVFAAAVALTASLTSAVPSSAGTSAPEAERVAARSAERGGPGQPEAHDVVLAVHGGAGTALDPDHTSPAEERAYRAGLTDALRAGQRVLRRGGDSVAAVEAAVRVLEDNALFNAGKGAVFTADAGHELDASIMRGSDQAAGAVAGVRSVRNPISAARLVMDRTRHVLLAGEGADDFAARTGLPTVTQDYYWTQRRWDQLMAAKEKERGARDGRGGDEVARAEGADSTKGTVGAVALDGRRHLAAATSTGGMTNKMPGRVGDSPLIGAGTYAKDGTVAASATGHGEVFIRGAATATIAHLMEYSRLGVAQAAHQVLIKQLPQLGGDGGVIALDGKGTFDAPHSSPGMLYGYLTRDGRIITKIFPSESPANE